MRTFADVLAMRLRADPGQPLVTFYDDLTGERVELSVTTWANWVAKASSLLTDELGLERGQRLRLDLPTHWLGTVFLGAAWNVGLVVSDSERPDVVVTGPDGVERWAGMAASIPVLACSLRPLGVRFAKPLPAGVLDVGVEIWGQPDAFHALDPAEPSDLAVEFGTAGTTQAELWEAAVASPAHGRLLSVTNPASPPGIVSVTGPLATSGSVVLVTQAGPDRLNAIADSERVTDGFLMP